MAHPKKISTPEVRGGKKVFSLICTINWKNIDILVGTTQNVMHLIVVHKTNLIKFYEFFPDDMTNMLGHHFLKV